MAINGSNYMGSMPHGHHHRDGCGCGHPHHDHSHKCDSHSVPAKGQCRLMLSDLGDVSTSVGNASRLRDGQALVYNEVTGVWYNTFLDYEKLVNRPTGADITFSSLSDVDDVPIPDGYVKWDSTGTSIEFTTSIPVKDVDGLSQVATTGEFSDLLNVPELGTVTGVTVDSPSGSIAVGNPTVTTNGTISVDLPVITDIAGTYKSPDIQVDEFGRVVAITGQTNPNAEKTEIVVLRYSAGASGTFEMADTIVSKTSGVNVTITDPTNCVVNYSFTGKRNLPTSILVYGQNIVGNTFRITTPTTATTTTITAIINDDVPDIISGLLNPENGLSIQSRPSDTGASGTLGKRAYLIVVFGF